MTDRRAEMSNVRFTYTLQPTRRRGNATLLDLEGRHVALIEGYIQGESQT